MIDVAEAIDAEAEACTFYQPGNDDYDEDGRAIIGGLEAHPAYAAVQPVSGRVLLDLPEGLRSEVSMVGWSRMMVDVNWQMEQHGVRYRVRHLWPRPLDGFGKFALSRIKA